MNWILTPKHEGKPWRGIELPFNGTKQEAWERACNLATGLVALFGAKKFSVRVDRTDAFMQGYEVGPDGHTIDPDPKIVLTTTTSKHKLQQSL